MEKTIFPAGELDNIEFVVIFAKYQDKWVYCWHKRRKSFEHPGGHVEAGETALQAAKRELFEESGITDCEMIPLWDYEQPWDDGVRKNNGRVYAAIARSLGELPESEMGKVELFDTLPDNYTYDREEALRDLERAQAILELKEKQNKAIECFRKGMHCSQSVLFAFAEECGITEETAFRLGSCFGSGMRKGNVCGACTGALMVLGLLFGERRMGDREERQRSNKINDEMMNRFAQANGTCICNELLGCDVSTPEGVQYARSTGLFRDFCPEMVTSAVEILDGIIREMREL